MQIDVTYSVTLENTSREVEQFLYQSLEKYGLPMDLAETVLEKTMYRILSEKRYLYTSALYESAMANKENKTEESEATGVKHTGTKEELVEAFKNLNKEDKE